MGRYFTEKAERFGALMRPQKRSKVKFRQHNRVFYDLVISQYKFKDEKPNIYNLISIYHKNLIPKVTILDIFYL